MDIPSDLSLAYLEELYEQYLNDPGSLDQSWQNYFNSLPREGALWERRSVGPSMARSSIFNPPGGGSSSNGVSSLPGAHAEISKDEIARIAALQDRVDQLIRAFRVRGHLVADIDPLDIPRPPQPELDPAFYDFSEQDWEKIFSARTIVGAKTRTLRELVDHMRETYCRQIGVQFMHIDDLNVKNWLQERMESSSNRLTLTADQQDRILTRLTYAVHFEEFIQKKYMGAKSFSLEGSETMIPLLDLMIEHAGGQGINEIVIGMAHRGRLNVLANIMQKEMRDIFHEFDDAEAERYVGRGDVKYHKGYSSDWTTENGERIHLSLCFNPSHLEFVNTVAQGRVRAKQDLEGDTERRHKMALCIHGDAAFAGEGTVQEALNMSQLKGYTVGGTIHVVVNNQVGFTTNPSDSRSSTYATDVAKMLQIPIFHVNGEDPEAVAQVVKLAMDFRAEFQRDVVIDMYAYRRRGHNEGDEPSFTQPLMYEVIRKRPTVRESYVERLEKLGTVTRARADEIAQQVSVAMEEEFDFARSKFVSKPTIMLQGRWMRYRGGAYSADWEVPTKIEEARVKELLQKLAVVPEGFEPHRKISRFLQQREEVARGDKPVDWGNGEALAFASLLTQGRRVRLSGQDCQRGTFSHRHAVIHDMNTDATHNLFNSLAPDQKQLEVLNSPLCETGVLGFEYGYSLDVPDGLTIWEAQFGDFANCAQVIIDQFIVSAEEKWSRLCGLVMLLPHGFEGMGPEHSSARLERFLSLAVNDNIQVANCTTPANFFHLLRRQVLRYWRKPLVIMSPKSLLRHPMCVSPLSEFSEGSFQRVIPDTEYPEGSPKRVLLCTGKVYYDMLARRNELENPQDFPIIRVEELHPVPREELQAAISRYAPGTQAVWVQEEPENMGAWRYMYVHFDHKLFDAYPLRVASRKASSSPATGSKAAHELEHKRLLDEAFGEDARAKTPDKSGASG